MRWDYATPSARYFISNGDRLWVYVPEDAQAVEQALATSQINSVLGLLLGTVKLNELFTARLLLPEADGHHRLELTPKKDARSYRRVTLLLDSSTYRIQGATVEDPVGNLNMLRFSGLEFNAGLPDDGFNFVAPEGVRIVKRAKP